MNILYYSQKPVEELDPSEAELFKKLMDIVVELRSLIINPNTAHDHEWQLEILQFLMVHSYWQVVKPCPQIPHVS